MDEELLARLGIDATGVRKGVEETLSALGQLEEKGGSAVAGFVSKASKPLTELQTALGTTASRVTASSRAMGEQSSAFVKLEGSIKTASQAYTTFLRNQATGAGPGGKGLASYSLKQLDQFQATLKAAAPTGGISGVSSPFSRALEQEINQRRSLNKQMISDDESFQKQLATEQLKAADSTDADLLARLRAAIAEREKVRQQEAADAAAAQAKMGQTVQTAPYAQRFATGLQSQGAYFGAPASGTLLTSVNNVASGRNTAAGNRMSVDDQDAASAQTLAQMREFYTAEEAATGAQTRLNAAHSEAADRNLPRLRYALYDVSTTLSIASAGFIAQGLAIFKTNVEYEKLFASVSRTSGLNPNTAQGQASINALRQSLVGLTEQIPVTFADVTQIATLAGQLGIAANQIAPFTKTVAEFSATTNVTVDAAATAFGRLSQILHDSNYKAMGDEIAYLGVKSVATESQIIGVASQIAVTTEQAHFGTQATLALATTLASLGVKQEAARGSFIRSFGAIEAAVSGGGKSLEDIARISGTTSADFAQQWGTDAPGAFRKFVGGLATSGSSVKANLADLHITAARDVQTFSLLAQNTDLLDKSFTNVANSSGYLDKAFAQQTNTVAGRLTLLQNQIKAALDQIGQSVNSPLVGILNVALSLTSALDHLTQNPFQAWTLAIGAGLTLLLGVLALVVGASLRMAASYLAVRQAYAQTEVASRGLLGAFLSILGITREQTVANEQLAASSAGVVAGDAKIVAGNEAVGASAVTAGGFLSKMFGVTAIIAFLAFLPSLIQGMRDWSNQVQGTDRSVDDLTKKILGLSDAASHAQDLAALKLALPGQNTNAQGFGTGGFIGLSQTNRTGNYGVQRPNGSSYQVNGTQGAINQLLTGQSTPGGSIPLAGGSMLFDQNVSDATSQITKFDQAVAGLVTNGKVSEAQAALKVYDAQMKAAGVSSDRAEKALTATAAALGVTGDQGLVAAAGMKAASLSAEDASQNFTTALSDIFGQSTADQKVTTDLQQVGQAIQSTGAQTALNGPIITQTLQDIYAASGDSSTAASRILGLADALEKSGLAGAGAVQGLRDAAYALDATATASGSYNDVVAASYRKAQAAAEKSLASQQQAAQQTVRTLVDYANDLNSTFSRAFSFRYGDQTALDAVNKGYIDLKNNAKAAADNLAKVRAELAQLYASRSVTQYQLGVANEYGDTTRGNVLRGDLASNSADIASKKQEETAAQDANSKVLTGNSAAAIANRAAILGQVQAGQNLLQTMAANGATTAQLTAEAAKLKKQLIDQYGQMGYNKAQVAKLAAGFDDFITIIKRIPRNVNVDVTADTNPAEAAIKEFLAKNKNLKLSVGITPKDDPPKDKGVGSAVAENIIQGMRSQAAKNAAQNESKDSLTSGYTYGSSKSSSSGGGGVSFPQVVAGILAKFYIPGLGFSTGGYTGDGPADQIAGLVHGREYVLNERATSLIPRQVLDSWNQGHAMAAPNVTTKVNVESGSVLSRDDRMFLAAALTRAPAVAISADQMGRAIDGAYVRAGQRGAN